MAPFCVLDDYPAETNSNFSFNLPWWDRLLGTYRDQPAAGHERMKIGLEQFPDDGPLALRWMLAAPFLGSRGGYPLELPTSEAQSRTS